MSYNFFAEPNNSAKPYNLPLKYNKISETAIMLNSIFLEKINPNLFFYAAIVSALLNFGCAVEAAKEKNIDKKSSVQTGKVSNLTESNFSANEAKISISPNSPADTVRVFYKDLREQRFRDAMLLTNLRPAIEGLTENELKDLQVDFAPLASQIPADVSINGEIISGKFAAVTAKLPDNETNELGLQEIKLRRENDVWVILTVDEEAEKVVKKEGKNYFFALKIETHQNEAKEMLNRINKAQMVYAMQNKGIYGNFPSLIESGFLPEDILTSDSTGYAYKLYLSPDKKSFTATAEPAVYGKTGKLSFWFEVNGGKTSALQNKDNNGKTLSGIKK